jgi:hypothetical protein
MDSEVGEYDLIECDYSEEEEVELDDFDGDFFFGGGDEEGSRVNRSEEEKDDRSKEYLHGDIHVETTRVVSTGEKPDLVDGESPHLSER